MDATPPAGEVDPVFYGCITAVALHEEIVQLCSGITIEKVFVDTFGPTLAAFAPPRPPLNSHPGPWVIVDYGAMHKCRVQIKAEPDHLPFAADGKDAAWLTAAVLRLQVPLPIRLAVGAWQPFMEMPQNSNMAKPFAYEAAPQQLGAFQVPGDDHRILSSEDLAWLKTFVPIAGNFLSDRRFSSAFELYDQAQWARTIETGMTLMWTSLEVLFDLGAAQNKTKAICRALSEYVTVNRPERDRAYTIIQKLCEQRGRIVHAGHSLTEQDAIQAFQLAKVAFRRVLIDQTLPAPFTP